MTSVSFCNLMISFLLFEVDKLESFLKEFPTFPNSFLAGGPADILVIELADQVVFETQSFKLCPF